MENKNLLLKLANVFNVNLDEEFEIKEYVYNPCKITEDGLYDCMGKLSQDMVKMFLKYGDELSNKIKLRSKIVRKQ